MVVRISADYVQRVMAICAPSLRRPESAQGKTSARDQVTLSARARDLAFARQALENAPETAPQDLDALARQIRAGAYRIAADEVAGRIVEHAIMTRRGSAQRG